MKRPPFQFSGMMMTPYAPLILTGSTDFHCAAAGRADARTTRRVSARIRGTYTAGRTGVDRIGSLPKTPRARPPSGDWALAVAAGGGGGSYFVLSGLKMRD